MFKMNVISDKYASMETTWVKNHLLGRGSSAHVFSASPVHDDKVLIAVKATADHNLRSALIEEGKFLRKVRGCPEIITCFGEDESGEDGEIVYNLLLEYAPGGTLRDKIKEGIRGRLPEHEVCWYAYMLLKGISHIHRLGIVHCDIKPANILVFPTEGLGGVNHIKIADFGNAKEFGIVDQEFAREDGNGYNRGTLLYSSPESVLFADQHEAPMDIWSLGITVMEMLTGNVGYRTTSSGEFDDLLNQVVYGEDQHPRIPENISDEAKDFLMRCLVRDPVGRWTADRLLGHPFIVENLMFAYGLRRAEVVKRNPVNLTTGWRCGYNLFSKNNLTPFSAIGCRAKQH